MSFYIFFSCSDSFFNSLAIQYKIAIRSYSSLRRIANDTFFSVEAFFCYIATFYQRYDRQVEMTSESVVAAIVCRHSHDGSCTISSQYIIANPDRNCIAGKRIDTIASAEYTCYTTVGNTFALCTFLGTLQVSLNFSFLSFGSKLCHQFAFGSQNHESNTEHCIGTSCKYSEFYIAVFNFKANFGTF